MVKLNGYWLPVVWGWLPDKAEISYKVFILLVKQKCAELGLEFDIDSVISDFELNIMKSIDDMLSVAILGCFFLHLKKIFKTKCDKKVSRLDMKRTLNLETSSMSAVQLLICQKISLKRG